MGTGRGRDGWAPVAVAGVAAAGAAPAVLAAAQVTSPWALGGAALGAAAVTAVGGVWQERHRRGAARREELETRLRDGVLLLPGGRVPRVRDLDDPIALGTHPSIAGEGREGRVPAYVPRDADAAVRERLAAGGFVLLLGDSAAGKSRTAYEAVRAALPDHLLLAPHDREGLAAAVERAVRREAAVLWLGDLERFLGGGGLTRGAIARVTDAGGVILATLRGAEHERLTGGGDAHAVREVRRILALAHVVRLSRIFSAAERERAAAAGDPRITAALRRAGEHGLAEHLAAGPELREDLESGWDAGARPRGAALVEAAIDCRRAGFAGPLPRALLEELHERYLGSRGGARLRPETPEEAWEWATRPRTAGTGLLDPADGGFTVSDYLVDARQKAAGPHARVAGLVARAAVAHAARAADADSIADTAARQGRYELAARAYGRAAELGAVARGRTHPRTLRSRQNLANMLNRTGRTEEAEREIREVLRLRTESLGPEHPRTLSSRHHLARVLRDSRRYAEAEREFREVLGARSRVLGPAHPDTLATRHNLARVLQRTGRLAEAERETREILLLRADLLGPGHPDTLSTRHNLARILRDTGRAEEAERELTDIVALRTAALGPAHPQTRAARRHLARLRKPPGGAPPPP
ncbi:tetratricopeptide repeat protein [Bailinhaonella thermotolerans]|uniref:Tetratricopeptide repeat protein n=1 Tax=Bailinhaonella thermotolerans TaxID=1070861 RepID=A0A3A4AWD8_9ACTN|nr:tetratricopeptide repeat protein [Bailinhaonella thermotolerans]RJL34570.1 tetratricopeptide repeat protein [Bailinhaonella thermotolerans]